MDKKYTALLIGINLILLAVVVLILVKIFNLKGTIEPVEQITRFENILPSPTPTEFPEISLENIFSEGEDQATVSGEQSISLLATGDVMLGRAINARSVKLSDFNWPWEKVAADIKNTDLTLINLESPLGFDCAIDYEGMKFCADKKSIDGLVNAGVDVANLANNHINDQGVEIANNTETILNENNILATGSGKIAYWKVNNINFAFLGYCDVCWNQSAKSTEFLQQIMQADKASDIIVASFHWGQEYAAIPSLHQIELAHLAIDSGADLVIGHHPHWIQPIEVYKGKLISYSLGNFIFDQSWSQKTKEGLAIKTYFSGNKLFKVDLLPVLINNLGQPEFAVGIDKKRIIDRLKEASFELVNN